LRVAVVAGEASGDALGAALIDELRSQYGAVEVRGVVGPRMRALGCEPLADAEELAVMGLFEVLEHLPRLWRLRARLIETISAWHPDVFVGIDAPGFNLGLAARLKRHGLRTVQYVSPQVWAWRQGRVRRMAAQIDLVLCLLPFEPAFYRGHSVAAEFVGHPLADQIPLHSERNAARSLLGLSGEAVVVALLPGSRHGEISRLGADFLAAARSLAAMRASRGLSSPLFLAPMVSAELKLVFAGMGAEAAGVRLVDGQARAILQAADVALVASGTATLETLLCGCPLVAAYRFSPLTSWLLRMLRLVNLPHFSLPNLLAGETLVPEFYQRAVQGPAMAAALQTLLEDATGREHLLARFRSIHQSLRQGGARRAAEAVLRLVRSGDR